MCESPSSLQPPLPVHSQIRRTQFVPSHYLLKSFFGDVCYCGPLLAFLSNITAKLISTSCRCTHLQIYSLRKCFCLSYLVFNCPNLIFLLLSLFYYHKPESFHYFLSVLKLFKKNQRPKGDMTVLSELQLSLLPLALSTVCSQMMNTPYWCYQLSNYKTFLFFCSCEFLKYLELETLNG